MAERLPSADSPRTSTLRVRRNVRWLAAGIIAVVLGGLGTWALFTMAAGTHPAVKVTKTVYRGETITASDLTVVSVAQLSDVATVPGDQLNAVVGQTARTDLPGGGLLVAGSYGAPELAQGTGRVGVKVEAGRIPAVAMAPGAAVWVIALPASSSSANAATTLPASVQATVASAPRQSADGSTLIDLDVSLTSAEQVARLAAQGRIAIMQKGP